MENTSNVKATSEKGSSSWCFSRFISSLTVKIGGTLFRKDCHPVSLAFKNEAEEDAYLDHFIRRFGAGNRVCCLLTLFNFVGQWVIAGIAVHFEILPQSRLPYAGLTTHVVYFSCCWMVGLLYVTTTVKNKRNIEWWMLTSCGGIFILSIIYLATEASRYSRHFSSTNKVSIYNFRLWGGIFSLKIPEWLTGLFFFFLPARTKFASLAVASEFGIGILGASVYNAILNRSSSALSSPERLGAGRYILALLYALGALAYIIGFVCGRWYSELHDRVEFWKIRRCQEQIELLKKDKQKRNKKKGGTAVEDLLELFLSATAVIQDAKASTGSKLLAESADMLKKVQNMLTQSNVYEVCRLSDEIRTSADSDDEDLEKRFYDLYGGNLANWGNKHSTYVIPGCGVASLAARLESAHQPAVNSKLRHVVGSSWHFSLLSIADKNTHILSDVGYLLLREQIRILDISLKKLSNYLYLLEQLYRPNPYHNQVHGATVAHTLECLLKMVGIVDAPFYCPIDKVAITIAALGHDVGHPGRTNQFFIGSFNVVALLWNDRAVLENYHAAWVFKLLEHEDCNFLESFDVESTRAFRKDVINMIAATDMSAHFDMVSKLKLRRQIQDFSFHLNQEDFWLVVQMCMKGADLSHAMFDWDQHLEWALRITEEFYQQGDEEGALGLAKSPLCDRSRHSEFTRSQKGFLEFVVQPLYTQLEELDRRGHIRTLCGDHLKRNQSKWEKLGAKGEIIEIPNRICAMTTSAERINSLAVHLLLPKDYELERIIHCDPFPPPEETL